MMASSLSFMCSLATAAARTLAVGTLAAVMVVGTVATGAASLSFGWLLMVIVSKRSSNAVQKRWGSLNDFTLQ